MAKSASPVQQAAAIPFQNGQVCLVRSSSQQWIFPKGHIEPEETADETATREAWEEGGVIGSVHPESLGTYHYQKNGKAYCVTVFLMQVAETADEWPERDERPRRWVSPLMALALVQHPSLRELLRRALMVTGEMVETSAALCG
jgi:8-oxo-dGTP pyrophosphatase MutT (NUDIX family)